MQKLKLIQFPETDNETCLHYLVGPKSKKRFSKGELQAGYASDECHAPWDVDPAGFYIAKCRHFLVMTDRKARWD